jgi:hypothetical protein
VAGAQRPRRTAPSGSMVAKRRHGARARRPGRRHRSQRPGRQPRTRPRRPGGTRRPARARRRAASDVTAFDVTAFLSEVAGTGWHRPGGCRRAARRASGTGWTVRPGWPPGSYPCRRPGLDRWWARTCTLRASWTNRASERIADDREELFVGQQVGITFRAELDHRDVRGRMRGRTRAAAHRRPPGAVRANSLNCAATSCMVFSRCPVRTWKIEVFMPDDCRRAAAITQPRCAGGRGTPAGGDPCWSRPPGAWASLSPAPSWPSCADAR